LSFLESRVDRLLDSNEISCRDEIRCPELVIRGGVLSLEFDTDDDAASFFDSSIIFRSDRRKTVVPVEDVMLNGGHSLDAD